MAKFTVGISLFKTLQDWVIKLRGLTFKENFAGYEWSGEIEPGEEVRISHGLKETPTRFIITQAKGTCLLVMGETKATNVHFYVKNIASSTTFTGKIFIMP